MLITNKVVVGDSRLEHMAGRTLAPSASHSTPFSYKLTAPVGSVLEIEVVLARAGSKNRNDIQRLPIAGGEETDVVGKSTRFGEAQILRGVSSA